MGWIGPARAVLTLEPDINYYPFHIGDYLSATRHLTWAEDAAFRRLLDVYYTTEKPLPAELRAVFRLVVASTDEHREAVENVLNEFFSLTDLGWVNTRADAEIEAMRLKQQKQREKANKRWHKPESEPGNASAMPRHAPDDATASGNHADAMPPTPTPTPTPVLKNTPLPPKGEDAAGFSEFWAIFPNHKAKAAAVKAWAKVPAALHAQILAAVAVQAKSPQWVKDDGQFVPHASTWLNGKRWEDTVAKTATHAPAWLEGTPFTDIFEANNVGCYEHNAAKFRDEEHA